MSKILIVTNHSYMLYRFRKELIQRLARDHEVVISTPFVGHEIDIEALGCRCVKTDVDRRGMDPRRDMKLIQSYRRLLRAEKPDMVITYSIKPNIYMGMLCRMNHVPYFVNVQGLGAAFQNKKLAVVVTFLYREALRKARAVFFENHANANEFLDRKIISQKQVVVLPGAGINLESYQYQAFPTSAERHFLYMGRIMREKGVEEWFDAARRLKAEYGDSIVFDMVGFFEDEYSETVARLQKEGVIVFHGFQTEPKPYYQRAHCVVMPSYHEGLSNVLLEAAAIGRPIVTTDIPGCREVIVDGKNGYLCEVKNAQMLYEKMKKVMDSPAEKLEAMGRFGRSYVAEHFAKETVVDLTVKALGVHTYAV